MACTTRDREPPRNPAGSVQSVQELTKDGSVRAAIFRAEGPRFCVGGDLTTFLMHRPNAPVGPAYDQTVARPATVAETKRLLPASAGRGRAEHLYDEAVTIGRIGDMADTREAIDAFLNHRTPVYRAVR